MISSLADLWLTKISRQTAGIYLVVFGVITLLTGILTWLLDVRPSMDFARYMGAYLFTGAGWSELPPAAITTLILFLSIMPNLLEFFSVGFALAGNLAVDLSVKAAIVFDALTDAPGTYEFAHTVVNYFTRTLPMPGKWALATPLMETLIAVPVLIFATLVIEVLFVSFAMATWRLLVYGYTGAKAPWRSKAAPRMRRQQQARRRAGAPHPATGAQQPVSSWPGASPPPPGPGRSQSRP